MRADERCQAATDAESGDEARARRCNDGLSNGQRSSSLRQGFSEFDRLEECDSCTPADRGKTRRRSGVQHSVSLNGGPKSAACFSRPEGYPALIRKSWMPESLVVLWHMSGCLNVCAVECVWVGQGRKAAALLSLADVADCERRREALRRHRCSLLGSGVEVERRCQRRGRVYTYLVDVRSRSLDNRSECA
jgi:hypothetical protein